MEKNEFVLTRGTKDLIKYAIEETNSHNRYELCKKIAFTLEERYVGGNLDYQLKRMGIQTTGRILEAIDIYFYKYHK